MSISWPSCSTLSGQALLGCVPRVVGRALGGQLADGHLGGLVLRLAEHLHDLGADQQPHHERQDRQHDHDLEQGHAGLAGTAAATLIAPGRERREEVGEDVAHAVLLEVSEQGAEAKTGYGVLVNDA
jgi:hypothetical protein